MNEETKQKIKKSKEENEKKLFDFMGYEIHKDSRQFITVGKEGQRYYGDLLPLFRALNLKTNDRMIEGVKVSELVEKLEKRDKVFVLELERVIKTLPR